MRLFILGSPSPAAIRSRRSSARRPRSPEQIVRATALDWTIARPPRLVDRSDETYRSRRDALPSRGFSMSFRAVAAFMLDAVERQAHLQEIVGLAA
jgi:NAD(P)H-binding